MRDAKGAPITAEYLEEAAREAEAGYDLKDLEAVYLGRPSLTRKPGGIRHACRFA